MPDPESTALSAAAIGAIVAALGYVARQVADGIVAVWRKRQADFARLVELQSLLRASDAIFKVQNELATRLLDDIDRNHPGISQDGGFESVYVRAYDTLTGDEKELHSIIRSMTENSVQPINERLSAWLGTDTVFKAGSRRGRVWERLALLLRALETHLSVWHAKYRVWIPDHPAHALVYMADESRHGVGFPHGLDAAVDEAVGSR